MKIIKTVIILFLWFSATSIYAQDRFELLEKDLTALSIKVPALNETVDISVNGVTIQEFLRGIANNVKININVDPALTYKVVNNFSEVRVIDVLLFVCREYNLEIKNIGNIISVTQFNETKIEKPTIIEKKFVVKYDKATDLLSVELNNDSLVSVAKEIELELNSIDFNEDPIAYFSKRKDGRGHRFIYLIHFFFNFIFF